MYPRFAQQPSVARPQIQLNFAKHASTPSASTAKMVANNALRLPLPTKRGSPSIALEETPASAQIIEAKPASDIAETFPESTEGAFLPSRASPSSSHTHRPPHHKVNGGRLADMLVSQTNKSLYISAASPANISQHFTRADIDSNESVEMDAPNIPSKTIEMSGTSSDSSNTPARNIDDAAVSCLMTQYFNERGIAGTLRGDSELLWAESSSSRNFRKSSQTCTSENSTRCDMPFIGSPNEPLLSGSSDESSSKNWLDVVHFPGMAAAEDFGQLSKDLTNSQAAVINLLKSRSPTSHDSSGRPPVRGRRTTAMFGQP